MKRVNCATREAGRESFDIFLADMAATIVVGLIFATVLTTIVDAVFHCTYQSVRVNEQREMPPCQD
ncbi:MAG: hypothetical protein P1U86_03765 [Verrucomicrobiales bacterium]|nr:hypothetical protein [Verrucomicrobiales bacterium]